MKQIKRIRLIFALVMIVSGLGVFSYPFIGNYFNTRNATVAVNDYQAQVDAMEQEEIDALKQAAVAYNNQVNQTSDADADETYLDLVQIGSAIGYITIPRIDLNLPMYEGTNDDVLRRGIGHIKETSYPIGGKSTHSALSGHRGMADAELFTNLDKMQIGNQFYLHVLDEVLAYEVDQISTVKPDDISDLAIVPGEDMCTLITCTPKGINSHRLLVRGHRVPYTGEDDGSKSLYQSVHTGTAMQRWLEVWPWLALAAILIIGFEFFLLITIVNHMKQRIEED